MVTRMTFLDPSGQEQLTSLQEAETSRGPLPESGKEQGGAPQSSGAPEEQGVREFTSGERQRAPRFAIQAPLRYRAVGRGEWHQGTIVNISETGVLFQTGQQAGSNHAVEMRFSLSTGKNGEAAVQVICRGMIVRRVAEPGSEKVTAQAARIMKFHFVRPGRPSGI